MSVATAPLLKTLCDHFSGLLTWSVWHSELPSGFLHTAPDISAHDILGREKKDSRQTYFEIKQHIVPETAESCKKRARE
jgi:hypothetical protein